MIGVFNASEYPNVAAAKLAAMHGCEVYGDFDLFTPPLALAYISAIFSWEREKAEQIQRELEARGASVGMGGPGISTETRRDIEDYALDGFPCSYTSVGCNRDCPWCIVPRMWKGIRELDEWGYAPVMLDPNILATSDKHKANVIKQLNGRRVEWNGGIDTRLLDMEAAWFLETTSTPMIFLSWDSDPDNSEPLEKALENLRAFGINPRNQVKVYILTGYEGGWESGYQRAAKVKELGATPFIMPYQPLYGNRVKHDRMTRDLARWCNRTQLLWSCDFGEYRKE